MIAWFPPSFKVMNSAAVNTLMHLFVFASIANVSLLEVLEVQLVGRPKGISF
jgi:hypothetical protein